MESENTNTLGESKWKKRLSISDSIESKKAHNASKPDIK